MSDNGKRLTKNRSQSNKENEEYEKGGEKIYTFMWLEGLARFVL